MPAQTSLSVTRIGFTSLTFRSSVRLTLIATAAASVRRIRIELLTPLYPFTGAIEPVKHVVVQLLALVLVDLFIGLVPRDHDGKRSRPRFRIRQRHFVIDGLGPYSREPVDDAECLRIRVAIHDTRPADVVRRNEVARLDDEGVAFPAAAWVTEPRFDVVRQCGPPIDGNDAGEMNHFRINDDIPRRLEDLRHVVVDGG